MLELQKKYGFTFTLAEQDLFTMIGWENPDIFYYLPCTFNKQVKVFYTFDIDIGIPKYYNEKHVIRILETLW